MLRIQQQHAALSACLLLLAVGSRLIAQTPGSLSPKQWALDAAGNELKVLQHDRSYLRYQVHQVDAKGDQVREVVESRDGTVARRVRIDHRPLTLEEDAAERGRLQALLDSPAAFAKHVNSDQTGKRFAANLLHQTPDAMIFSFSPGQPQRPRSKSATEDLPEIVLDFKPDPAWTPPNLTSEALTGFEGRLWIDPRTHSVTRLEGDVFRGVNVGLGFLGHVSPGGKIAFEQAQVGDQRWIVTHFAEHLTLRIVFKTILQNSEMDGTNFMPVPEMSYVDAIHLLLSLPLPTH